MKALTNYKNFQLRRVPESAFQAYNCKLANPLSQSLPPIKEPQAQISTFKVKVGAITQEGRHVVINRISPKHKIKPSAMIFDNPKQTDRDRLVEVFRIVDTPVLTELSLQDLKSLTKDVQPAISNYIQTCLEVFLGTRTAGHWPGQLAPVLKAADNSLCPTNWAV